MASSKQSAKTGKSHVSPQVREYLSENGKKGGEATRELIEAGKEALGVTNTKKKK